jgi:hypothetical protein
VAAISGMARAGETQAKRNASPDGTSWPEHGFVRTQHSSSPTLIRQIVAMVEKYNHVVVLCLVVHGRPLLSEARGSECPFGNYVSL